MTGDAGTPARSRDIFHQGGFEALQPIGAGHRSGSDALLLAAALPDGASGRLAELGAGAGVAAFAALTANPGLEATLVEIDPTMAACARDALALPANAHLAGRAQVLCADVTLRGAARMAAGLPDAAFDYVIANPPYHLPHERGSPDSLKVLAHRLDAGGLEAWMRTAAAIVRPGGMACLIWRTDRLEEALAAMNGRFGELSILPLHARQGQAASRIVITGTRGSRAPLSLQPGVVLHGADGRHSELALALLNGRARLATGGNKARRADLQSGDDASISGEEPSRETP